MKRTLPILLLGFLAFSAHGAEVDNLVVNPSFEDGTSGWQSFWCREAGQGEAALVSKPAQGGSHALRVVYRGARDWSFGQEKKIPVHPGELFAFSTWVKTENLQGPGQGQLSVVTRNEKDEVLDWQWGLKNTYTNHGWEKLSGRFLVPEGCATIQFRITGDGPGTTFWDDLELRKIGEAPSPVAREAVTLTAPGRVLVYEPVGNRLSVAGGDGLPMEIRGWGRTATVLKSRKTAENRLDLVLADAAGNTVGASASLPADGGVLFTLKGEGPMAGDMEFPGPFLSDVRQDWVVPMNEGLLVPSDDPYFKTWDLVLYGGHGLCMPFVGLTDGQKGWIAIAETPNDVQARFTAPQEGKTSAWSFVWEPQHQAWGYERKLWLAPVPKGGYVGVAKAYRRYAEAQGLVKTLEEKASRNPNVDKLIGAVDVWWWRKAEAWTQDDQAETYARQMKEAGIGRVLWSHEQTGASVSVLSDLGFLPGRYDIYQDVYSPDTPLSWVNKDGWPDCLDILPGGDWMKGWVSRENGKDYVGGVLCSSCILDMARSRVPGDLKTHPYGARFLDTTTASPMRECYSPKHPLTRTQDRQNKMALLDYISQDEKLVTGSETGVDMAVPHLDYFEGMMSLGPYRLPDSGYDLCAVKEPQADYLRFQVGPFYRIPLFELVYHDCVVDYWYWGDSSNRLAEEWDVRDLFNALYGTPPLWIMDRDRWERDKDRFVRSYRDAAETARRTGYSEMTDHEFLTTDHTVQETVFSDGVKVWVNFGKKAYRLPDGEKLDPGAWKASYPPSGK